MKTTDDQCPGKGSVRAANRSLRRIGTLLSMLGVALAASSCVAGIDPNSTGSISKKKPLAANTQAVEKGAPEVAMLKLSGLSVPVTGNRHRIESTSAFQTLLYPTTGTLGENSLAIEIGLADSDRFRQMAMTNEAPASIKKLFPGVKMVPDTAIHQNGYGQFGVATGTLGKSGGACVYAWQAVKDPRAFKTAVSLSDKSELELPVRVTLRYCDAKARPEQLADLMRTLSIRSVTSRNLDLLR
ncbi:cellulose biosynthesis protein BcsN [Agrobacterium vitis]|uniref:cellulose biosynthesis protein BcsN n=1 Tax=Agrobacterium vitis TaxID=373 RepID=UPI001573BDC6|nr:cellulose biosynthesis protein BcsN [Agrobacterium vitis]NSZ17696.1 cellulose biosynthesis protein BcsN [Agrobacterium vitis]QZO03376.1 cellulose biosynthesis protein BcsN [Agrobacterium vitis]UJL88497.1 cellulose biosynthesis protein BcsN [Agrobacterium vitis]